MSNPVPLFHQLFEPSSRSLTYVLGNAVTGEAIVIDPVLETVDRDLQLLRSLDLDLQFVLETHLHADHITGAGELRAATGAKIAVSRESGILGADLLLEDSSVIAIDGLQLLTLRTPGHTEGCVTYYTEGMAFTGDCLLIDATGRTDLPGGSSESLYDSIHAKIWSLPADTLVFPAHDYRGQRWSTVDTERRSNSRIGGDVSKPQFIQLMNDLKLAPPAKMPDAIPRNLLCGLF